jgi:hypothetical protein
VDSQVIYIKKECVGANLFGETFDTVGRDPQEGGFAAKDRGIWLHHLRIRFITRTVEKSHFGNFSILSRWNER